MFVITQDPRLANPYLKRSKSFWSKEKSTEKIDGAVATVMALDRAIRLGNTNAASVYDDRGILFWWKGYEASDKENKGRTVKIQI